MFNILLFITLNLTPSMAKYIQFVYVKDYITEQVGKKIMTPLTGPLFLQQMTNTDSLCEDSEAVVLSK